MKLSSANTRTALVAVSCLYVFFAGTASSAQVQTQTGQMGGMQQLNSRSSVQQIMQVQGKEQEDYDAFTRIKPEDLDTKIKLGQQFLGKYPNSKYAENVDVALMNAYYGKQDWQNFYTSADSALALKPDEVDVLVTVGWVIPHVYDPKDPDADKLLDKAENYEKRAMPAIAAMPKPDGMKDNQFSAFKVQKADEAHSALGLVYFRRADYDDAVKELQEATQNTQTPDQTDLFVLGTSLEQLKRHTDAAQVFDRCAQIAGGFQDQCKQNAARAKTQGK